MFYLTPLNASTILARLQTDVYQLHIFNNLTLDDQISGLILVGKEIIKLYPEVDLFISINPSKSGYLYASLDTPDEDLDSNVVVEKIIYNIALIIESILFYKD